MVFFHWLENSMKEMKIKVQFAKWCVGVLPVFVGSLVSSVSRAEAPLVRIKSGVTNLTVNAEPKVKGESLKPMVTFQPSILWEVPEFSSRLGIHYLQELGGPYGLTPVSGIGISGYYFISGLSTSYSVGEDGTIVQKSKPGFYMVASLTPINFNLNRFDESNTSDNLSPSFLLYDLSAGVGYDYPISQNMVIALEIVLRNGSGTDSKAQTASYSGTTIYLSFATCYY